MQQAIAELGYVPNLAARSLAGRRADAVALAITEKDWRKFGEPFFSEVVRAVGDALADTSVQLLLTLVRSDTERTRVVEYARGGRVDGVLLMSVHAEDPLPDMLADAGLPTVLLGRRSGEEQVTYVDADNAGGARDAVAKPGLGEHGGEHRRGSKAGDSGDRSGRDLLRPGWVRGTLITSWCVIVGEASCLAGGMIRLWRSWSNGRYWRTSRSRGSLGVILHV